VSDSPRNTQQILQQLKTQGYVGGYSILKEFIQLVRPVRKPAFLMLEFAAGECAQVDWGSFGTVTVGSIRRRLSFFVMVLCYSRLMYVEFTLCEGMEQFLSSLSKEEQHQLRTLLEKMHSNLDALNGP